MRTVIFTALLLACTTLNAQEELPQSIRVAEWNEFQATQQELVTEQRRLFAELSEARQNINQINVTLLGVQKSIQQVAGRDVHCDALKTKYNPYVEYTVIGLAVVGVLSILYFFVSRSKKTN